MCRRARPANAGCSTEAAADNAQRGAPEAASGRYLALLYEVSIPKPYVVSTPPTPFPAAECARSVARAPCKCAATCAGVLGGVVVYTFHDIHFTVLGYVWIAVWYAFAVFEMVYVKVVVDSVQMTTWSRTYYQARPRPSRLMPARCETGRDATRRPLSLRLLLLIIYTVNKASTAVRWHGARPDMVCLHVTKSHSVTRKARRECWRQFRCDDAGGAGWGARSVPL